MWKKILVVVAILATVFCAAPVMANGYWGSMNYADASAQQQSCSLALGFLPSSHVGGFANTFTYTGCNYAVAYGEGHSWGGASTVFGLAGSRGIAGSQAQSMTLGYCNFSMAQASGTASYAAVAMGFGANAGGGAYSESFTLTTNGLAVASQRSAATSSSSTGGFLR